MTQEEKEGYWTPLEKRHRDWLFKPVTKIFGLVPGAANILTIVGFGILFWAMIDLLCFKNPIGRQVWFIASAWLTDLFDGPVARNNKNVTAFGTIADHTRDFFLILWMVFLSFYVTASLKGLATVLIYSVLVLTVAGMFGVATGMWLYQREKRYERPEQSYSEFINEFLLKDLVTTVGARVHTALTAVGDIFYLAGAIWKNEFYFAVGAVLLVAQLVSLGFYLHEVFQASYEDRVYKIRKAFQKKIERLEEALRRKKRKRLIKPPSVLS